MPNFFVQTFFLYSSHCLALEKNNGIKSLGGMFMPCSPLAVPMDLNKSADTTSGHSYQCRLEVVDKLCYYRDMLDASGGAKSSSITRMNCGCSKFRSVTTPGSRAVSLSVKGSLYRT